MNQRTSCTSVNQMQNATGHQITPSSRRFRAAATSLAPHVGKGHQGGGSPKPRRLADSQLPAHRLGTNQPNPRQAETEAIGEYPFGGTITRR